MLPPLSVFCPGLPSFTSAYVCSPPQAFAQAFPPSGELLENLQENYKMWSEEETKLKAAATQG